MLKLFISNEFKKDIKRLQKKHYDIEKLNALVDILINKKTIPNNYRLHTLKGDWAGYKKCHIDKNWLLIFYEDKDSITLIKTGSHDELFK